MLIPNLIIISGTGNKSGKTTIACRIIEQFRHLMIVSVKITPHYHESTPGLKLISEGEGFSIYEETNNGTSKDTSRMLKAGAAKVFYARVTDNAIACAFDEIFKKVPAGTPIICESHALRKYAEPGLYIIMTSKKNDNDKNINSFLTLPHVEFDLAYLSCNDNLPLDFISGKWISRQYGD
jgi:hypothetical protein